MPSPFKKVLMIGATTGIGRGMSERLVKEGSFVIATGRTRSQLQDFFKANGSDKSDYEVLDLAEIDKIPAFAEKVLKQHPDIDCVWLNAGVQTPQNPASVGANMDMNKVQAEVTVNYTSQIAVAQAVLPHLQAQSRSTLVFTSSILAYLPFPNVATYSATKSATHFYAMCLRDSLKRQKSPVRVVEMYPPLVQTELHGPHGRELGMPLKDFIDEAWPSIAKGHENFSVGKAIAPDGFFEEVELKRIETLSKAMDTFAPGV